MAVRYLSDAEMAMIRDQARSHAARSPRDERLYWELVGVIADAESGRFDAGCIATLKRVAGELWNGQ